MAWLPVSRERFEDERRLRLKAEAELEETRNALIEAIREQVPKPPEVPKVETLTLKEDTDLSQVTPIPGRPTIAYIVGKANQAAALEAKTMGARGIAAKLADTMRVPKRETLPKAANGD